jgi:VWFA-related protein
MLVKLKVKSSKSKVGFISTWVGCSFYFLLFTSDLIVAQAQQRPTFRSGIDVVGVEVQVVDRDGKPMPTLGLADFEVRIDGHKRPVVSADLVSFDTAATAKAKGAPPTLADLIRTRDPRLFILAVDEISLRAGDGMVMREAARHFVEKLDPSDYVGVYRFPIVESVLTLSRDRADIRRALEKVGGAYAPMRGQYHLLPSEVVDITGADRDTFAQVVRRECQNGDPTCPMGIHGEASVLAAYAEGEAAGRVLGLRVLLEALSDRPERKTLVILSGGLMDADRATGRPDIRSMLFHIGREAALANTSVHILHLDSRVFGDLSESSRYQPAVGDPPLEARASRDADLFANGLERFADAAGGGYVRVKAGTPDYGFDRVLREASAYYLIGIEPEDRDRNGWLHVLRVSVKAKVATVRARTHVLIPRK